MRALVLGGTGAMGRHLVSLLSDDGWSVDVTTRSRGRMGHDSVRYIVGDAHDRAFLENILMIADYDVIVDFMVWRTETFSEAAERLLSNTRQYLFISSYRIYADAPVLKEDSPRLMDVSQDEKYLRTDEYALAKARCEDMLRHSGRTNWTIARPGITYDSGGRFQLGILEASTWLWRSIHNYQIAMPDELLSRMTTMTSGADVAYMLYALVGNDIAFGEAYNLATSESLSWSEVLEIYRRSLPVTVVTCTLDQYAWAARAPYQLFYDRMYDRVIDNSKVLKATGIRQADLRPVRDGLHEALSAFLKSGGRVNPSCGANARIDTLTGECCLGDLLREDSPFLTAAKYVAGRLRGRV